MNQYRREKAERHALFSVAASSSVVIPRSLSSSAHMQHNSTSIQVITAHANHTQSPKSPRFSVGDVQQLESIPLPPELVSCIEVPLTFISRDRLVFLDHNSWLCSWCLPLPSKIAARRPSGCSGTLDGGTAEIKRHYFFPSDWISPQSIWLCTVMVDGTTLCPRKGDVALVRYVELRN